MTAQPASAAHSFFSFLSLLSQTHRHYEGSLTAPSSGPYPQGYCIDCEPGQYGCQLTAGTAIQVSTYLPTYLLQGTPPLPSALGPLIYLTANPLFIYLPTQWYMFQTPVAMSISQISYFSSYFCELGEVYGYVSI